jgi:hypothetical protein
MVLSNNSFRKSIKKYLKTQEKEAKVKGDKFAENIYHQYKKTFF